jgi:hypothetical protein
LWSDAANVIWPESDICIKAQKCLFSLHVYFFSFLCVYTLTARLFLCRRRMTKKWGIYVHPTCESGVIFVKSSCWCRSLRCMYSSEE